MIETNLIACAGRRRRNGLCALWVAVTVAHSCLAQTNPTVEVTADLLDAFPSARVSNPKDTHVRRPATAGGVREDGLFAHPVGPKAPARVAYAIDLPRVGASDMLLFAFDVALSDGVKLTERDDGVRFLVEVNGAPVFSEATRETRWQPRAVDLTPFAGRQVTLALVTDSIANSSFDWSTWGQPRVLRLRGVAPARTSAGNKISSPVTTGVLALRGPTDAPLKIRLQPVEGTPVEWDVPALKLSTNSTPWFVKDFSFPGTNVSGLQVDWAPQSAVAASNVVLAAHLPKLEFTQFAAARAIVMAGETVPFRLEVKNTGRGKLAAGEALVALPGPTVSMAPTLPRLNVALQLPELPPGELWRAHWDWQAPAKPGPQTVGADLSVPGDLIRRVASVDVFSRPTDLRTLQNDHLKIEFARQARGYAYATLYSRQGRDWVPVAVWSPLLRIVSDTRNGETAWEVNPRTAPSLRAPGLNVNNSVQFLEKHKDADGVEWEVRLGVRLEPNAPVARVRYEWRAAQDRTVRTLLGPSLYVGEGTSAEAKTWGIFPGLEYLWGAERSSNERDFSPALADRRTPDPRKITVPLMAVTVGPDAQEPPARPDRFFCPDSIKDLARPAAAKFKAQGSKLKGDVTVALLWNPLQRWDGEHALPAARFASPNLDEGQANHRLALFLPSAPEFVPENSTRATTPYSLTAGKTITLDATLAATPGPVLTSVRQWITDAGGLPQPNPWPRTFQQSLDVCRAGLLTTVWDAKTEQWRHCIDWAPSHAPGLAALLWVDSQVAEKPEARQQARARVELAVTNMLRDGGPGLLTSQAACHIMQWEFPFLYGHLAEAMPAIDGQVRGLIRSQGADGGWVFHPGNEQQRDLGATGDSVLGLCAHSASTLLRYARITGDTNALAAGEKALRFMEQFRVPRGAQVWECPMYEPDILAAAYAIRAYHDAWRVTGNPRWLHDAVYWAETGVPFVYLWGQPDKPMMLGATIPVFGSTFYTHTWLAVPVQWCGLVYAYHVLHLAEDLARAPLPPNDSPLPLALNFKPADWRRIVELITVSGLYQQYADGPRIGSYPDSISRFEQRNPAFINPEDILLNVLALNGIDPDVKTARVKTSQAAVVLSSGARILNPRAVAANVRFDLEAFPKEPSHTLVAGLRPREVLVDGRPLPRSDTPLRRTPGWWWDDKTQRAYLVVPHAGQPVGVEIVAN
jgi:hypothetical protein